MINCPNCHSEHILKEGYRHTRNRGDVHKYRCKDCQHWFTPDDGFWHKHNDSKTITQAIDLYFSSLSSRKNIISCKSIAQHISILLIWLK